jgi:lysine 2,3-aminomutase
MPTPFVSKRAKIYADVPNEKWNDWRWQLSHRLNTADDIDKVLQLTESERKALNTQGLFRVEVTPYFISLLDPDDLDDPIRKQIIPRAEEMQSFTAMMEDSLAEDRHSPVPGLVHRL